MFCVRSSFPKVAVSSEVCSIGDSPYIETAKKRGEEGGVSHTCGWAQSAPSSHVAGLRLPEHAQLERGTLKEPLEALVALWQVGNSCDTGIVFVKFNGVNMFACTRRIFTHRILCGIFYSCGIFE